MSRAALRKLEEKREETGATEYDEKWEDIVSSSCCGDAILASAFLDVDISLTPSWPTTQGEAIQTIDWTKRHWCETPTTWHHMSAAQIDSLWAFEAEWIQENVGQILSIPSNSRTTDP